MKFGGAPKCPRCTKSVYAAEQQLSAGRAYHKLCFSCKHCHKMLDSTTVSDHDGDIYCKSCHGGNYGPTGFRSGGQGAMMHTTAQASNVEWSKPSGPDTSAPKSLTKFCSSCGAQNSGGVFCSSCGKQQG
eukprot:TRINITY_DN6842_c0_g1_i1.p1 TRINITY_DN6842_c0_g1~~TRINITY_DN6842_c0_g1_i1.p1  ORF type:complete len:148 (+),score=31.87 TRINITY_DN6842_c0_g1_i1:55-444(+)